MLINIIKKNAQATATEVASGNNPFMKNINRLDKEAKVVIAKANKLTKDMLHCDPCTRSVGSLNKGAV